MILAGLFVLLVVGGGLGIWGTVLRGAVHEVTGTYVERVGAAVILVRHDAVPALAMKPMELMAFPLASPALLDRAGPARGDRVRLNVRQAPEGLVVTRLDRLAH